MFFTQEDYKKIQQWLIKNSVKDTEFNEANTPFNGNEIVSIVQGNQNKKVFLKDLVSQIFNLGISDFVNITDKYDAPNISLEDAIRLIPSRARKEGQVITFLDRENHWHIYQFKGVLNQWNVLDQWEDLFNWEKIIIDSILPDEEDLTKSLPDVNGNSYLSLKDREYNPEDFSGLGRVILRKNIVEIEDPIYGKVKKNVLYQDMINKENTIYEIRYDFTLENNITIPANCVLKFDGGSLRNGTIDLNDCNIIAPLKPIFNGVRLSSNYNKKVYAEWFNILPGTTVDNETITNIIKYTICIIFGYGTFTFNQTINISSSDNCKIIKGVISEHNGGTTTSILKFDGCDGFNITAGGKTIQDLQILGDNTTGTWDVNTNTYINSKCAIKTTSGVLIKGLRIFKFGYGIYKVPTGSMVSLCVYNTTIGYCSNNGIEFVSSGNGSINHVILRDNYITKCGYNADTLSSDSTTVYSGHGIHIGDGNGYEISGNVCEYCTGCGIYFSMTVKKRIYASIIGNTFERNKYTQIFMQFPRNYDTIFVKGNAYSDAGIPVVSNALPQREVCYLQNYKANMKNNNITLEDYNFSTLINIPRDQQKEYIYKRQASPMWFKEDSENVLKFILGNPGNPTGFKHWKVTEAGWYRLSFTAKVDTGSAQLVGLILKRNNVNQGNNALTFNTTEYTTKYTGYIWADVNDYINIAASSYYQNITATYIMIKDYDLEKAISVGTALERPLFSSTTGLGHLFFNKDINTLQYWNGTTWVDATGATV